MPWLSPKDRYSYCRPDEAVATSFHWDVTVDFDAKVLRGHVDFNVSRRKDGAKYFILDSSIDLTIKKATHVHSGVTLNIDRTFRHENFGICVQITLPENEPSLTIRVEYETSPEASALFWLPKETTVGKRQPFLYSRAEIIHVRSVLPCQDSLLVKSTFTATIRVPNGMTVVLSAIRTEHGADPSGNQIFRFAQEVSVPVCLLALAVGDIDFKKLGPRSRVWAEWEYTGLARMAFTDIETILKLAENLLGPYIWGVYDIVILPPLSPVTVESTCVTFLTPEILISDNSLMHLLVRKVSHAWIGSLVTMTHVKHYWIRDGWAAYVERKIMACLVGETFRTLYSYNALTELRHTIYSFGHEHKATRLVVNRKKVNPNYLVSIIPYEKGHTLFYYLETLLGEMNMRIFLRAFVQQFQHKSVNSQMLVMLIYKLFSRQKKLLDKIVWSAWLYDSGVPPNLPSYGSPAVNLPLSLRRRWVRATNEEVRQFQKHEYTQLDVQEKLLFFDELLRSTPMSVTKVEHLSALYCLESEDNVEIHFRWLLVCIRARWRGVMVPVARFLNRVGHLRFVLPLFAHLGDWAFRSFACDLYERLKPKMTHLAIEAVDMLMFGLNDCSANDTDEISHLIGGSLSSLSLAIDRGPPSK